MLNHTESDTDGAPLGLAWMETTGFQALEDTFNVHVMVRFCVVKIRMYFHIGNR